MEGGESEGVDMAQKSTHEKLVLLFREYEAEAFKFDQHSVKASARRARNALLEIQHLIVPRRAEIQAKKKVMVPSFFIQRGYERKEDKSSHKARQQQQQARSAEDSDSPSTDSASREHDTPSRGSSIADSDLPLPHAFTGSSLGAVKIPCMADTTPTLAVLHEPPPHSLSMLYRAAPPNSLVQNRKRPYDDMGDVDDTGMSKNERISPALSLSEIRKGEEGLFDPEQFEALVNEDSESDDELINIGRYV
jgi:hypothetical protein